MAAPTVDPTFFPALELDPARHESSAPSNRQAPPLDNPIGAFRGLAFGLLLEAIFVIFGVIVREVARRLL